MCVHDITDLPKLQLGSCCSSRWPGGEVCRPNGLFRIMICGWKLTPWAAISVDVRGYNPNGTLLKLGGIQCLLVVLKQLGWHWISCSTSGNPIAHTVACCLQVMWRRRRHTNIMSINKEQWPQCYHLAAFMAPGAFAKTPLDVGWLVICIRWYSGTVEGATWKKRTTKM